MIQSPLGESCVWCRDAHEAGEFGLRRSTAHEAMDADYEPIWDVCPCKCHASELRESD